MCMIKVNDKIEIKEGEIFGFVGLVDSGRTTILKQIYRNYSSIINYVDDLPWFQFLKVKTFLRGNSKHEYVKKLDLDINKRIKDLNYTETRKFLFLRAIFTDKKVIILDEPLLLIEKSVKKVMLEIIKKLNKTIIITFDNIYEANFICNRYAIVKNHKIIEVKNNDMLSKYLYVKIKAKNIDKASLPLKNMKINFFNHNEIEFLYDGDINDLIKCLVKIEINYLEIKEATLEELSKYL